MLVENRDGGRVVVKHTAAGQRVVGSDQGTVGQARQDSFVVVDVSAFVGVDEDEVERAVEVRNCLERRPDAAP